MNITEIVLKALKDPKCQPIAGCKENDSYFLAYCWALEVESEKHSQFAHIQQKIFRFLQKHAESESLFRLRRQFENKNMAESAQSLGLLYEKAEASENILPHEEAREEIKKIKELLK